MKKQNALIRKISKEPEMQQLLLSLSFNYSRTFIRAYRTAETAIGIIESHHLIYEQYKEHLPEIVRACLLLDIGYTELPSEIINKTGCLTQDEYALIKTHPNISAKIAAKHGFSKLVQELIIKHHERYDESGYPAKISLQHKELASYIAIADVFSALVESNPHRNKEKYTPHQALNLLRGVEDSYFDYKTIEKLILYVNKNFENEERRFYHA